ncbi:MAG: hypothetical protein CL840_06545 [Crocinitomicaceae bacterium]|nr:hypothetical protein [Crocinitomicaceae bacterium]
MLTGIGLGAFSQTDDENHKQFTQLYSKNAQLLSTGNLEVDILSFEESQYGTGDTLVTKVQKKGDKVKMNSLYFTVLADTQIMAYVVKESRVIHFVELRENKTSNHINVDTAKSRILNIKYHETPSIFTATLNYKTPNRNGVNWVKIRFNKASSLLEEVLVQKGNEGSYTRTFQVYKNWNLNPANYPFEGGVQAQVMNKDGSTKGIYSNYEIKGSINIH